MQEQRRDETNRAGADDEYLGIWVTEHRLPSSRTLG
jgi:hypothetical protein